VMTTVKLYEKRGGEGEEQENAVVSRSRNDCLLPRPIWQLSANWSSPSDYTNGTWSNRSTNWVVLFDDCGSPSPALGDSFKFGCESYFVIFSKLAFSCISFHRMQWGVTRDTNDLFLDTLDDWEGSIIQPFHSFLQQVFRMCSHLHSQFVHHWFRNT